MSDRLQHKPGVDREAERKRKWAAIKRELELSEMGWALLMAEINSWPVTPLRRPTMLDETQYDVNRAADEEGVSVTDYLRGPSCSGL